MDLLSPDHTHSSLAVRESRSAKRARITDVGGFKVGSDGRFMITDEENDKKLVPGITQTIEYLCISFVDCRIWRS